MFELSLKVVEWSRVPRFTDCGICLINLSPKTGAEREGRLKKFDDLREKSTFLVVIVVSGKLVTNGGSVQMSPRSKGGLITSRVSENTLG